MCPILFRIHGIPIHTYGLLIVGGFAVAMWWSVGECKRRGLPPETGLDYATWALISGILGARLLYVLLNWSEYSEDPVSIFRLPQGGLSFHGSVAGGILAIFVFCRRRQLNFWRMADMLTPCVILGYPIARMGCLFNGCCYGSPTSLPWGMRFPNVMSPGQMTPPSHPAQVYSSILTLFLFLLLLRMESLFHYDGQKFCFYLIFTALDRFVMEVFRKGATAQVLVAGLTDAQVASILMILTGLLLYRFFERNRSSPPRAPSLQSKPEGRC
ncbi:MAG: prolipoprotein diacylglyceryl transferase [Armatimonadetes bacterium]|nr:prolipoprotein diacylglyceryl transferase [Armatimonadota bacterium]